MAKTNSRHILAALGALLLSAGFLAAEKGIFYAPMLDAYQAGRLDVARDLARKYLADTSATLNSGQMEVDRDAAVVRATDLVISIMTAESQQGPTGQYGQNADLLTRTADLLGRARDVEAGIAATAGAAAAFRTESLVNASVYWIQAATPRLPASQVTAFYNKVAPVLQPRGIRNTQDAVQSPKRLRPAALSAPAQGTKDFSREGAAIRAAITSYLDAVVSSNAARLAATTGASPELVARMQEANAASFAKENVRRVVSYRLPEALKPGADLKGDGPDYQITISGIQLTVIDGSGNQVTRSIDKAFRLRRQTATRWRVVMPHSGVQQ